VEAPTLREDDRFGVFEKRVLGRIKLHSVALVPERTIQTERPPLVGE
jgi:hypothetical protein